MGLEVLHKFGKNKPTNLIGPKPWMACPIAPQQGKVQWIATEIEVDLHNLIQCGNVKSMKWQQTSAEDIHKVVFKTPGKFYESKDDNLSSISQLTYQDIRTLIQQNKDCHSSWCDGHPLQVPPWEDKYCMGNCTLNVDLLWQDYMILAWLHDSAWFASILIFWHFLDFDFDLAWLHDFGAWWSLPPLPRCVLAKRQMTLTQTCAPPLHEMYISSYQISDINYQKWSMGLATNQSKETASPLMSLAAPSAPVW